jgi:hypothetical protein
MPNIDMKHKNIGATVGLVKNIHKLTGDDETMLRNLADLFIAEAAECDFRHEINDKPVCVFNGSTSPNLVCCAGECPLGAIVDEEIETMDFGCDPEKEIPGVHFGAGYGWSLGGHRHIGYTGWRKYWNSFKAGLLDYYNFYRKHWKLGILILVGVILVDKLSKWAGTLSVYLW